MELQGRYFDGSSLEPVPVQVVLDHQRLVVKSEDGRTISAYPVDYIMLLYTDRSGSRIDLGVDGLKDVRIMLNGAGVRADVGALIPKVLGPVRNDGWAASVKVSAILVGFFALLGLLVWQLERVLPYMISDGYAADLGEGLAESYSGFFGGTCSSSDGDQALQAMTTRLTADYDTRIPLMVRVTDNEMVNAFALPGGQIVLFRGLIANASSAEEVAGVLAHEIGHVKRRHALRGVTRAMGLGIIASLVSGSNVSEIAQQLVSLSFNRNMEREADEDAVIILNGAQVSLEPLAHFFDRLAHKAENDLPEFVGFLSTHPMSAERAEALRMQQSEAAPRKILSDDEWASLRNICGG